MSALKAFLNGQPNKAGRLAALFGSGSGVVMYPHSVTTADKCVYFLARAANIKQLGVVSAEGISSFEGRSEAVTVDGEKLVLQLCTPSPGNAEALRQALPFLRPRVIGLKASVGCGDRIGLATPGHVRSVRKHTLRPIFAQQSIREMERTGRTPRQVLDDAMWGVFQEGWDAGYGADADHLKTIEDVERCVEAGFAMFTIDPSDHVDAAADMSVDVLSRMDALPWQDLEDLPSDLKHRYAGRTFDAGGFSIPFDDETVARAAVKYGEAVAHTSIFLSSSTGRRHARCCTSPSARCFRQISGRPSSTLFRPTKRRITPRWRSISTAISRLSRGKISDLGEVAGLHPNQ